MSVYILGIESSCDDTSAAILKDNVILANVIANQDVHRQYGGVVPELASRAHQQNIIPVIESTLKKAEIEKKQIDAVAFTRGPGLLGSLLVGVSFAKAFALARASGFLIDHFMKDLTLTKSEANVIGPSIPQIIGTSGPTFPRAILIASRTAGILPAVFKSGFVAPSNISGFSYG